MWRLCVFVAICASLGCSRPAEPADTQGGPPSANRQESKEEALYEQVRSGRYQISTALDPLEVATKAAQDLVKRQDDKATRSAVDKLRAWVDGAASKIANYSDAPPAFEEFTKQFDTQDDERLAAINGCTEALHLLYGASQLADDMLSSDPPAPDKALLENIRDSVTDATEAIGDAKAMLSGKAQ